MTKLHRTTAVAKRLGVSVWTITRTAKAHEVYTDKFPTTTGGYLFSDADVAKLASILNRQDVPERGAA